MDEQTLNHELHKAWSAFCVETGTEPTDQNYDSDYAVFVFGWFSAYKRVEVDHAELRDEVQKLNEVVNKIRPPF